MTTTIAISEDTRKRLLQLKLDENFKNMDELIKQMIAEHKLAKLTQVAKLFQERMKQKNLTLADLVE
jgi:F0F1-type ATP synthase delta subunit